MQIRLLEFDEIDRNRSGLMTCLRLRREWMWDSSRLHLYFLI